MIMRKVYRMPKAGSIANLQLCVEALDHPAADEVCVAVEAIGLNFADIFAMQGLYKATPPGTFIPGLEFSGTVILVGSSVTEWRKGDRVMGATKFGGYASHINIHQQYIIELPAGWSMQQGAGFLVQGLTAWYALVVLGNLQSNSTVLIHSAAGGVGILANRICKKFNAYTIGTVGSERKVDFLKTTELYDEVIVRGNNFFANLNKALQGRALHLVLECIGGKVLKDSWQALAPMGRMITYGSASFTSHGNRPNYLKLLWKYLNRPRIDPLTLPTQNKSLMGFNLIFLYENTALLLENLHRLQALQIEPQYIGHEFNFAQMHEAIRLFQQGKTMGKVVVVV